MLYKQKEDAMKTIDFKSLLIGILSTVIAFIMMGQSQSGFLRVETLEVVDAEGNAVIRMGSVDGNGSIETYNTKRNLIVGITSTIDGEGVINTYNANEKQIVKLGSTVDGKGSNGSLHGLTKFFVSQLRQHLSQTIT